MAMKIGGTSVAKYVFQVLLVYLHIFQQFRSWDGFIQLCTGTYDTSLNPVQLKYNTSKVNDEVESESFV